MARRFSTEAININLANDAVAGTPLVKPGHSDQAVQFDGTYTGGTSLLVQWTLDQVNWVTSGAAVTTPGEVRLIPNYSVQVRIFTTLKGTGAPTAKYAGYEELWP